jgi:hypothetical protein
MRCLLPLLALVTAVLLLPAEALADSSHCTATITSVPTTLSSAGLYCMNQDFSYAAAGPAITIAADNVTVDLNGHTLKATRSPGDAEASFDGVAVSGHKYFSIIDGTISGFTIAVFVSDTSKAVAEGGLIANLQIVKSPNPMGIFCNGCVVRNNIVTDTHPLSSQNTDSAVAILVDGTGNQVTGNHVFELANGSAATFGGAGIELDGSNSTASNNYVANTTFSTTSVLYGVHTTGTNMLVTDNQVQNIPYCYWLEATTTKYRNNLSSGCGEAFGGSAAPSGDLGGNN